MAAERAPNPASGEQLRAEYLVAAADEPAARARAQDLCLEQTEEFPEELVPEGFIRDQVVGRIEALETEGPGRFRATIRLAIETAAGDLVQLLNVLFGNISLKPGLRLERLDLPERWVDRFPGPRFGRRGLREWVGVPTRPLICTALKPMGLDARALADQAHRFALGGIDLVKDDHGLTDQVFAPFAERVKRCADAVSTANARTGLRSRYVANVTGPADQVLARAHLARSAGAGGLLVSPFLTGLDALRALAADASLGLPVLAHPAFGGSFVTAPANGIAHGVLFGTLTRLAGADVTIFPNHGGRFWFSREECLSIAAATAAPLGGLRPSFPSPGGGMTTERAGEMRDSYGREFVLLIGGGLHRRGPDLAASARHFVGVLEAL
jgi:ribulose-bisphosphate carboxylase large chain